MKQNVEKTAICRTIFIVLISLVLSGNILSQNNPEDKITKSPINQLIVKGNITVFLIQGTEQKIYFDGSDNAVKQINTSVNNKILTLSKGHSLNNERVTVFLTIKNLENIKTLGNVEIETPSNICIKKLSLNISKETDAIFFFNTNQLDLNVSGSGNLYISGNIDILKVLGTKEAKITGNIKSNKLSCRTSNSCNIILTGSVYNSFISAFNQSSIDLADCKSVMSSIVVFDYSKVKVNSKYVTDIWAFDNSTIHYFSTKSPLIMENSINAKIIKGTYKEIAKK